MAGPTLERTAPAPGGDGTVYVLSLGDDENATGPSWLDEVNALLDEVEAADGPRGLVTFGRGPKHYSNGLDTAWMGAHPAETAAYVMRVQALLARLLVFPAPTVAAVNGHAFGAGAFLTIAHDHAVMREDRGFLCWPEVHLGMPFTVGLITMVRDLLPTRTAHEAVVTGRRYDGGAALAAGVVDGVASVDELLDVAVGIAAAHAATAGSNLGGIKRSLHRGTLDALLDE